MKVSDKYFEQNDNWIGLLSKSVGTNVFYIEKDFGRVIFTEGCNQVYANSFTKKEAVEMLEEAITWIKNDE